MAGPLESTEPVQYLCTPQARAQRFQHARTSKLSFMDATASRAGDQNGRDGEEKKDAAQVKKVSLLGMFRYADRLDVLLMVVGTVAAVGNGVAEPLVTVLFGKVIDSFGDSTTQSILRSVSKVSAPLRLCSAPGSHAHTSA